MTQSRPNYVLKLADGTERVFTPSQPGTWSMRQSTRLFSENELSTLGATPVPQPKPKKITFETAIQHGGGHNPQYVYLPEPVDFVRAIVTVEEKR